MIKKMDNIITEWENRVADLYSHKDYIMIEEFIVNHMPEVMLAMRNLEDDVSGYIEKMSKNIAYSLVYNRTHHKHRQRFTLAHELGHYVLHKDILGDGTNDTKMYRTNPNSSHYNPNISTRHENEANEFASRILMPQEFIKRFLKEENVTLSDIITVNKEDRRDKKVMDADIVERIADNLWISEAALRVRLCRKDLDDLRGEEGFHDPEKITK